MDRLTSIRVFCRISELGSFVAVAREEGLSATMISNHVAKLEKRLGVTLLNRTTRKVNLTEIGKEYYEQSKQLLDDLENLEDAVSQKGGMPTGTLNLIAPVDFGGMYMGPAIQTYQETYPNVTVRLFLSNQEADLSEGVYDIAIRITDKLNEGLVARPVATTELCTFASAGYLSNHGIPFEINDLHKHQCLHFLNTPHGENWLFQVDGKVIAFKPSWHFSSNNGAILCEAAVRGMGIVQVPRITAARYVTNGELIEVLHDFRIPHLNIYAIYQQRRYVPAKISTFISSLTEYLDSCPLGV
jgi:DNA-binding transcriptional LysR family regulator